MEHAFKPKPPLVQPSGAHGHKTTKTINPSASTAYSQGTQPQTFFYKYENILNKTRKRETVSYNKTIGAFF